MPPLPPVTRATRPSRGCSAPTRRSHDLHLARCCCAEVMDRAHHCCPLGGAARRPGGLVRVDDRQVVHARHLEAHQAYKHDGLLPGKSTLGARVVGQLDESYPMEIEASFSPGMSSKSLGFDVSNLKSR